jgi:hypothetical protein
MDFCSNITLRDFMIRRVTEPVVLVVLLDNFGPPASISGAAVATKRVLTPPGTQPRPIVE